MGNLQRWIIGLLVLVVIVWGGVALFSNNKNQAANAGPIKIGVVAPLSGDAAAYGEEIQKVLNYRLPKVNEGDGADIELVWEDGKCSGSDAVTAFQKLKDVDGVRVVIGGVCSSETLAMAPLTTEGQALVVSAASSNPTIEGASPYVFTLSYSDQTVGETLAQEMNSYAKVAIITEQNDYNIGIRDVWVDAIGQSANVEIVANEVFPKGSADLRGVLAKVKNAQPDAILLNPNVGITAENLLKQLAEMKDWTGYKLYTQFAYLADESRKSVGDFANGMVIVDAPTLTNPEFLAYKAELEAAVGELPNLGNYYTASSLDALDILSQLVRELGDDPQKLREAIATRSFTGFLGDITFNGKSFKQGSKGGIYNVENGKAVFKQ